jgi:hypothetical protein
MTQRSLFPKDGLPARLRADFEAFWTAYPPRRPNPRALAEAEFAKAVAAGAAPAHLVAAAGAYAAEMKRKGVAEDFVVHAATFLRQRRFIDYQPAPDAPAPAAAPRVDPDHDLWPHLRGVVSDVEFIRWMQPLQVLAHTAGVSAQLVAPTRFHRDWLRQHYAVLLKGALRVRWLNIDIMEDLQP